MQRLPNHPSLNGLSIETSSFFSNSISLGKQSKKESLDSKYENIPNNNQIDNHNVNINTFTKNNNNFNFNLPTNTPNTNSNINSHNMNNMNKSMTSINSNMDNNYLRNHTNPGLQKQV